MWYRAFGWPENPFSIRPSPNVVGLEEIKEALFQDLLSGSPALLLGPTGMGKTSFLLWLRHRLSETRFTPVYLNLHDLPSPQDKALQTRLRTAIFLRRLRLSSPILLLDEAQELAAQTADWLKATFDRGLLFSFVFACSTEPPLPQPLRSRIGPNVYHLQELSLPERLALLKARMDGRNPFEEEALVLLAQAAGPSPRALLQAAELACKRLAFKAELGEAITAADLSPFFSTATTPSDETSQRDKPPRHETKTSKTAKTMVSHVQGETKQDKEGATTVTTMSWPTARDKGETRRDKMTATTLATVSHPRERDKGETRRDKQPRDKERVALSPMQRDILRALAEGPKTIEELCKLLRSPPGSVRRQLSRLRSATPQLIDAVPGSTPKRFGLTQAGQNAVI